MEFASNRTKEDKRSSEYCHRSTKKPSHRKFYKVDLQQNRKINSFVTVQYPGINSKKFITYLHDQNIALLFSSLSSPLNWMQNQRKKGRKFVWRTITHHVDR